METAFLGLDTSNYTTSLSLTAADGAILLNAKRLLPVKEGEVGLRQQNALFEHTKNLPALFEENAALLSRFRVAAIGVSARPRDAEGSYMPCFLAGVSAASAAASSAGIPLFRFSHQAGHIRAALSGAGLEPEGRFTALHVSGGTTEMLLAKKTPDGYDTRITGGTLDLCAGQAIDRTGVMLGFPFPCGRYLEEAALTCTGTLPRPRISVHDRTFNLSGLQNLAEKDYLRYGDKARTSLFVLEFIAASLKWIIEAQLASFGAMPVLCAGGVMSNSIIKRRLAGIKGIAFAPPELSADNAVGIALLARDRWLAEQGDGYGA
ncbi:MAG: hypothetical protein IJR89_07950 [Clostridia bacterium]|nr:hypothetical protein [Clostridia bacterium]